MRILQAAAALAVALGFAGTSPAQSLGEIAAKEKEKRQGRPAPKVITENDLGRAGKRGTLSMAGDSSTMTADASSGEAAPAVEPLGEGAPVEAPVEGQEASEPVAPAAGQPPPKKEKTEEEIQAERRAEWQKKLDLAREKVKVHQNNVDTLQRDLNEPISFNSERRVQEGKLLESEKASLAAARAEVEQLDEEGRRNGWPR